MAKISITRDRIRRQADQDPGTFLHDELVATVAKYFCRGMPMTQIRRELKEKLDIPLTREMPYRLVAFAAQKGWLLYRAPLAADIAEQIMQKYQRLKDVTVVRTGVSDDISYHVAEMLLDQVCRLSRTRSPDRPVHIGFAGGKSLRKSARHFAEMLREPREDLPKSIVFHAMVAGFNVTDPSTDPNGFFTYFAGEPPLQVRTSFVGLLAPGIVRAADLTMLRSLQYIRDAFELAKDIDIIVTSAGGHWQEAHSSLCGIYAKASPRSVEQLNAAGCIGDMMWCPMGKDGPLDIDTEMRTVTLMELSELPGFIERGKTVLLLLGPCGKCGGPKQEVLRSILASDSRLVTHLVVDSRSARGLLNE